MLNKIRESKSLDPLPLIKKQREIPCKFQETRRSTRSLENCDKCGDIQIIAVPDNKLINNNFPNGNVIVVPNEDEVSLHEDADAPLLSHNPQAVIVHRRRRGSEPEELMEEQNTKRWRSLESVPASCNQLDDQKNKKIGPRNSIRSWLVGLFNGNGLKASNASLRKGGLNEYNNLQPEKESIV